MAFICFAALDATAKYVSQEVDSLMVVWARFVSHGILVAIVLLPRKGTRVLATSNLKLQLLRSLLLFLATAFNFVALVYLPMATTASIFFTVPLMVAALSVPLLGERVGWRRWSAILVGFCGVLVIVQPGAGDIHWAIALSLGNAVAVALYQIATRSLAARDHSDTSSIYSPVVGVLILLPALPFVWSEPQSWFTWVLLAATGVFGGVGHWILIIAHRYAPASLLAPFSYTHILWMTLAGYLVFGHLPGIWTGVGALIVIASGLYVFHRERVVKDSP